MNWSGKESDCSFYWCAEIAIFCTIRFFSWFVVCNFAFWCVFVGWFTESVNPHENSNFLWHILEPTFCKYSRSRLRHTQLREKLVQTKETLQSQPEVFFVITKCSSVKTNWVETKHRLTQNFVVSPSELFHWFSGYHRFFYNLRHL